MNKLLIVISLVFLAGCESTALKVTEDETSCIVVGSLLTVTPGDQEQVGINVCMEFKYQGNNCQVIVVNDSCANMEK